MNQAELQRRIAQFERTWKAPTGFPGWFSTVNNTVLGARYMITSLSFFLLAGVMALLMRTQLLVPQNTFLGPETYNQLFTMHGSTMMFLFVIPFLEGLANFILPSLIGARDLAYPKVTAFGYWLYLFGGIIFLASFLTGSAPDVGWFAYPPLSGPEFSGIGTDFWLLGLGAVEFGGIATGIELAVSILKLRAPGMTMGRMPLFAWALLVTAFMIIFAFTVLFIATLLLELDRALGLRIFDPAGGGNPIIWQHLFWIFGHPEVYIMFIPATGIVSMIVPTFARRPIVSYVLVVLALIVTGFVSFGLWVHHMLTTGLPALAASFFTATSFMIALASGTQIFAWIATLWGSRPRLATPLLFVLGFIVIFMLGGVTGVMVGSVPFNTQVHDTHFVVAHFHYVLIGGVVFPIFAALYYWLPQIARLMLNERLGAWNFWLTFTGFNLTFLPMHLSGLRGMPRRVYTYQEGTGLAELNLISTLGSYLLAAGFLLFFINFVLSWRAGRTAPANPWDAGTLEWSVPQPTPNYNFRRLPVVSSHYPLWEQADLVSGAEPGQSLSAALDARPSEYRATLVTSVAAAEPQGLWHLAGPSYEPVLAALGVTLVAFGPLVGLYWLMVAGALLAVSTVALWLWPARSERESVLHDELNERLGLPLLAPGPREPGWWGVVLFNAVLATAFAILFFCYFYLQLFSPQWPQGDSELPGLLLPGIALALLLASVITVARAAAAIRRGDQQQLKLFLAASVLLAALFLALQTYNVLQLPFLPQLNAYASIFWILSGLVLLRVLFLFALGAGVLLRALLGHFTAKSSIPVQHMTLVWYTIVAAATLTLAVLYLVPLLVQS
jgi:cytochrome c oxidase subunit I+III